MRGELGEALVDQRQPALDLGDHPLRRAVLLGDALRQPVRASCSRDRRSPRAISAASAPALPMPADACSTSAATAADWTSMPGPDFVERRRCPFEQGVERAGEAAVALRRPAPRHVAPAVSISARRAASRSVASRDQLVSFARALGEIADLLTQLRALSRWTRFRSSAIARSRPARFLQRAADRRAGRRYRCARLRAARSSSSPCRLSFSLLPSNSRVIPPSLPVASSPSCIKCWPITPARCGCRDPLREHLESASSDCASLRIAMTERVKRSDSLRRVRPNISHTRPSSASGPAAIASHCATYGDDSGCPASVRPADQAGYRSHSSGKDGERDGEHLAAAGAPLVARRFAGLRPAFLVERGSCATIRAASARGAPPHRHGRWQRFGALGVGCHRNADFTIFEGTRKRLERNIAEAGRDERYDGGRRADRSLSGRRQRGASRACFRSQAHLDRISGSVRRGRGAAPIVIVVERVPAGASGRGRAAPPRRPRRLSPSATSAKRSAGSRPDR